MEQEPLLPKHGGYQNLVSFRVARLCYDVTVRFCDRYISGRSRTHDQMVQAARSGVQNIAEGSEASATSKKTELKLTNVARASLEELRLDYEDFLRQRGLRLWSAKDPRRALLVARRCQTVEEVAQWVKEIRELGLKKFQNQPSNARASSTPSTPSTSPEIAANAALILLNVASSLLERQLAALASAFTDNGGFTERLHRIRTQRRRS
ncbi:MAG: four helix bundle protein [Verrucomicrobiaceae bacterium]|nr:MAG: four helix bundle protein [Verrucomicrobiaceae bacterium]